MSFSPNIRHNSTTHRFNLTYISRISIKLDELLIQKAVSLTKKVICKTSYHSCKFKCMPLQHSSRVAPQYMYATPKNHMSHK